MVGYNPDKIDIVVRFYLAQFLLIFLKMDLPKPPRGHWTKMKARSVAVT